MQDVFLPSAVEVFYEGSIVKAYGPPESLVLEEVEPLKPGPGQVVIGVKACGVNFPDTSIIEGKYQFKPEMPFSPGGEVAGAVNLFLPTYSPDLSDRRGIFQAENRLAAQRSAHAGGTLGSHCPGAANDYASRCSWLVYALRLSRF